VDGAWAPTINPAVEWVELDGEVVIYDGDRHQAILINATGALLWQLFDGTATVDELADDVVAVFGVSREDALDDVLTFAEEMAEQGLLVGSDRAA
jgi:hypothetical protein